jgi:hypothetical protein
MRVLFLNAVLLLLAVSAAAAEESASGSQRVYKPAFFEAELDEWELRDHMQYRVELKAWKDELLTDQTELALLDGTWAIASMGGRKVGLSADGRPMVVGDRKLRGQLFAQAKGAAHPKLGRFEPMEHQAAALTVSRRVSLGDVQFFLYLPHADRYELTLYCQTHPGAKLEELEGFNLPVVVHSEPEAEVLVGTVSGPINTKDLHIEVPDQPAGALLQIEPSRLVIEPKAEQ